LGRDVIPAYLEAARAGKLPGKHLPLVGKKWYKRLDIGQLLDRVEDEDGDRVYKVLWG
jgi:hypothetical protein